MKEFLKVLFSTAMLAVPVIVLGQEAFEIKSVDEFYILSFYIAFVLSILFLQISKLVKHLHTAVDNTNDVLNIVDSLVSKLKKLTDDKIQR